MDALTRLEQSIERVRTEIAAVKGLCGALENVRRLAEDTIGIVNRIETTLNSFRNGLRDWADKLVKLFSGRTNKRQRVT